jgi:hypothetical protein
MTRDERQALFDQARQYLGDVQLDPGSTEADVTRAKEAVDRAYRALRGTPHTLLGTTRRTA